MGVMYTWMGYLHRWMMNGCIDEQIHVCLNIWVNGCVNGWIDSCVHGCVGGQIRVCKDRWVGR